MPKHNQPTTPEKFAEGTPHVQTSPGDFSLLEIVMAMQGTLSKLEEAVEGLKSASKSHGEKLESIGKDVHTAKVLAGIGGGILGVLGVWIGIILKTILETLLKP